MADFVFSLAKKKILSGQVDLSNSPGQIINVLLMQSYTADQATHEFVSDVLAAGAEVSASGYSRQTLSGKTLNVSGTSVIFDASDVAFGLAASGQTAVCAIVYRFVSSDADSPVIARCDTGFPLVFNGAPVVWIFDATNGVLKIP